MAAQKKSLHAAERDPERVDALGAAFLEALPGHEVSRLRFGDETSGKLTYCRRYGRALGGARVRQGVGLHSGANVPVVRARGVTGLGAVMALDGALAAPSFARYSDQVPGPTLAPGHVVVLDNWPVHKLAGMRERLQAWGAQVRCLPPDSPDFAPIERGWSQLSPWRRTAQARTREALSQAVATAADWITAPDAQHWLAGCGYHVS